MTEHERPLLAIHEAGHVVACLAHYVPFRYVTLRSRGDDSAAHVYGTRHTSRTLFGLVAYAGPMAEAMWLKMRGLPDQTVEDAWGSVLDWEEAAEVLPDEADQSAARDAAFDLLLERWAEVEAVAAALLASSRALTARQCRDVVAAARHAAKGA